MFRSNQFVRWWSIFTTSRWWKRSWFQSTSQWRHWTKWRWAGPLVGNVFMGRWVKERFKSWCFSSCSFVFAPGRDFPFFFHVYRFQNLRIDHELLVPCKYILSQMSQICDMYIYIFIHNRNSRWHGSKFLKVTRSVDFFLPRLGTHRHRLNQMDLALSTHTLTISSWMMKCCPPIFYKHLSIRRITHIKKQNHQETKEKTLVVPKYVPKIVESKPIHVAVHQPPKTPGVEGGGVDVVGHVVAWLDPSFF